MGTETLVNTETANGQSIPSIIARADGGWVVTWVSYFQDGSLTGVYQQAYDAVGILLGNETQVNAHTSNNQHNALTAPLADGGWVVTWQSFDQDGDGWGIYQRAFHLNNDAPTGADDTITIDEDDAYTFSATDFGFSDTNENALTAVIITALPGNGTLRLDGVAVAEDDEIAVGDLGLLVWTPEADGFGAGLAEIGFKVRDDGGTDFEGSDTSVEANVITFDVAAINDSPELTGSIAGSVVRGGSTVLARNDLAVIDVDGEVPDLELDGDVTGGHLALAGDEGTPITRFTQQQLDDGLVVFVKDGTLFDWVSFMLRAIDGDDATSDSVEINIDVADVQIGGGGRDVFTGLNQADHLDGMGGNDVLKGLKGNDVLLGGGGRDKIFAGKGKDVATGGGGKDTFVFAKKDGKKNTITDFRDRQDKLDLKGFKFKNKAEALREFTDAGGANNNKVIFNDQGTKIVIKGIDLKELGGADILI